MKRIEQTEIEKLGVASRVLNAVFSSGMLARPCCALPVQPVGRGLTERAKARAIDLSPSIRIHKNSPRSPSLARGIPTLGVVATDVAQFDDLLAFNSTASVATLIKDGKTICIYI